MVGAFTTKISWASIYTQVMVVVKISFIGTRSWSKTTCSSIVVVVLVVSGGCCQFLKGDRNVVSVECHFLDSDNRNVANIGHDVTDGVVPLDYFNCPNHGTSAGLSMGFKVGDICKVYSTFRAHKAPLCLDMVGF